MTDVLSGRDLIRGALADGSELTVAVLAHRTKLAPKVVATALYSMRTRTEEISISKVTGSPSTYRLVNPSKVQADRPVPAKHVSCASMSDLELKLAQLRTHEAALLRIGVSLVSLIIEDYEGLIRQCNG